MLDESSAGEGARGPEAEARPVELAALVELVLAKLSALAGGSQQPLDFSGLEALRGRAEGWIQALQILLKTAHPTPAESVLDGLTARVGQALGQARATAATTFHRYLLEHTEGERVVVDGRFVLEHGGALLAALVTAVGTAQPSHPSAPRVDYHLDIPSILKTLLLRPINGSHFHPASGDSDEP